ncbi:hypothetical protein [Streptomyces sp. MP131-18]|uniref:hypothetical protein n=1 Tax=Streptomyces sp. MP131-18 TaxID=1857892 RepID=UPI00097BDCDF|nr:hypothetical protein [Streptomyces sp. MP131-18]ONK13279.1 hypothetical protein STBA_40420 [Streptomyces sp. MP131-18]
MTETVRVRVVLLFGDQAQIKADASDAEEPVFYPAAPIAEAVGVPVKELAGMRLLADVDEREELTNWRLP